MNKLFTKIAIPIIGMAMAIGVGVGLGRGEVRQANAVESTITFTPGTDTGDTTVTKGGVTVTLTTMNNASYYQIYKNQSGTFSCSTGSIKQINFTCTVSGSDKYGPGCMGVDDSNGTYTVDNKTGTWTGSSQSISFTASSNQVRISALSVVYDNGQQALNYTMTFKNGGGVGSDYTDTATTTSYTLPTTTTFTKSGFGLKGWQVGENVHKKGTAITVSGDTTITAVWYRLSESSNPYSVLEAREAVDYSVGLTDAYVTGIVSAIPYPYTAENGVSFDISADGLTTSDQLRAFKTVGSQTYTVDSTDDVQIGDVVILFGTLLKYNSTYELDQGNQIISLTRPQSFTVTDSIENGSLSSTANVVENNALNLTITPEAHYSLPSSITVTMGGNTLVSGTGYTYDSSTGAFSIASVTGNVVISGSCVEDAKYTVTYVSGENGGGSNFVVSNVYEGSYTLISFSSASSLSANSGYRFKAWSLGGNEYNPGASITIDGNATITAVYELIPLGYVINFGSTKDTNPTEIKTDAAFKTTYSSVSEEITTSEHSKVYGKSTTQLKCGSGSATAALTFTIPSDRYISAFSITIATAGGTSLSITSGANNAQTESQNIAAGTLTFNDYLPSEQSSTVSMISVGNGAFYVTSIEINYVYRTPSLSADPVLFDMAINTSQNVSLTPTNLTPSSYTAIVQSGTSLTAGSVAFNGNTATITAGNNTGTTVIRITGTQENRSAYVDITITVTQPRNLTSLDITTVSDITSFRVGQLFDVGSLVITATFDAEPLTVIYSKAAGNLGLLTFDPEIGYQFVEGDIGTITVTAELTVGNGYEFVGYDITVSDKIYAQKVTSVSDLWDGQEIYLGSQDGERVNSLHNGGSNLPAQAAVVDETKGLSLEDLTREAALTVHREKIDSTVYYSFYRNGNYLCSSGGSGENQNFLTQSDTLTDNCRFTIAINDGVATITNKGNNNRPLLRWNSSQNYFSCFPTNTSMAECVIYAVTSYDETTVAQSFETKWLHMNDYQGTVGQEGSGWCKDDEHGYYAKAKAVWQAMGEDEKAAISSEGEARLAAWAVANGESLDGNMDLVSGNVNIGDTVFGTKENNVSIIITVISVLSLTALGGFFFIKKRKEQ